MTNQFFIWSNQKWDIFLKLRYKCCGVTIPVESIQAPKKKIEGPIFEGRWVYEEVHLRQVGVLTLVIMVAQSNHLWNYQSELYDAFKYHIQIH